MCVSRSTSTTNLTDTVMSWALMLSARASPVAVLASSKDKVKRCGVLSLTRMLETPSLGSMPICDAPTCERSKKPDELTVNVGEVPALMFFGETLRMGC